MINLRYHVFSLMAVFAALAIGIVVGSTTVKSGLVDSLRSNVDRAEQKIAEVESENKQLAAREAQLDLLSAEGAQLLTDDLLGEPVLWVTTPGVDDAVVNGLRRAFDSAGATSVGTVAIEDTVFDDDAATVLGTALGSVTTDVDDLRAQFGREIAERIDAAAGFIETPPVTEPLDPPTSTTVPDPTTVPDTTSPDTTVPESTVPDTTAPFGTEPATSEPAVTEPVDTEPTTEPATTTTSLPPAPRIDAMMRAQLGDLEDLGVIDLSDLVSVPLARGASIRIVVVLDTRGGVDVAPALLSFVDSIGSEDVDRVVVLAEAGTNDAEDPDVANSLVQDVRASGRLRDEVSTVDNAEEFAGWAAAVLSVRDGIAGTLGHFGYRTGSESLLPPPVS